MICSTKNLKLGKKLNIAIVFVKLRRKEMKKKISLLLMLCLLISSFSGVYAADKKVLDYSIPKSFTDEKGQKITIEDQTYEEYIKDLAKQKNVSIEEAVILDKSDTKETLYNNGVSLDSVGTIIYRTVKVDGSLEENDNFSARLITKLKIYAEYSYRQIENVIYQDIQMISGGGYNTTLVSEVCSSDPKADSSEFPVSEIYLTGAAQFQIALVSSTGGGISIPGFSLDHSGTDTYYYLSDTLDFVYFYNLY